jgi:hypothetical protein
MQTLQLACWLQQGMGLQKGCRPSIAVLSNGDGMLDAMS